MLTPYLSVGVLPRVFFAVVCGVLGMAFVMSAQNDADVGGGGGGLFVGGKRKLLLVFSRPCSFCDYFYCCYGFSALKMFCARVWLAARV